MDIMKKALSALLCAMMCFAQLTIVEAENVAVNVALNKPVIASSVYPMATIASEYLTDGNVTTRWGNYYNGGAYKEGNHEESVTVDLGAEYSIDSIEIVWEGAYAKDYTIQASVDGSEYFDIKDIKSSTGGTQIFSNLNTEKVRFVRLALHEAGTKYGYSIWELKVFSKDDSVQPQLGTVTNIALGKSVHVYPSASGATSLIVDGDTRYEYARNTNVIPFLDVAFNGEETPLDADEYYYREDAYVIVDLQEPHVIDSFTIYDFDNTTSPDRDYMYSVAVSNDPNFDLANQNEAEWTYIGRTPKGLTTCITDFDLEQKQVARYIKLYDLRVYGAYSFAMTELEAYGIKASDVESVKAYANTQLDEYKADIPVSDAEAEAKAAIINEVKTAVEQASDATTVIATLNSAFERIDEVVSVSEYRNEKINEMNNYKAEDRLFSEADNATQASKLEEAIAAINATANTAEIDEIVAEYKAIVDTFVVIANLALNKPVVASSQEATSVRPVLAVDGDTTARESRWGSAKGDGPHWIYVDLEEPKDIRTIKVYWENRKATNYAIQVSNDAQEWTSVQTFETRPQTINECIILQETVNARYVRLYIEAFTEEDPDGGITYNTVSIYELEVYGIINQDPQANVARGKIVQADSQEADTVRAELGVDGDRTSTSSRWGSAKGQEPHWIYVDLGAEMDVRTLKVYWETRKATAYAIQISNDAQEWTTVKEFNDRPKSLIDRIVLDETYQARYVKLAIDSFTADDPDSNKSWNSISIFELEVYGGVVLPTFDEYLNEIVVYQPTAEDTTLRYALPQVENENYLIKYNGTDYEEVIDTDGTIYKPIVDTEVMVSFKIEDTSNGKYEFSEVPVTVPGTYVQEEGDNEAPNVLPELTEWKGYTGYFNVVDSAKIVIADEALSTIADEFVKDYKDILGKDIAVVVGTLDDVNAGDYYFAFTTDLSKGLKEEGYLMSIEDAVYVESETTTGAYWATRTILQAIKACGNNTMPKGLTRDYPMYEVRGVMLDVGRITFSLDYLKQVVKQMSWYKMNDFHLHLNDNYIWLESHSDPMNAYSGFRLESDIKKGGTVLLGDEQKQFTYSADLTSSDVFYTKAEFSEFMKNSAALGVNIIPEFDTPAHSLALTKVLPELRTGTSGRDNDHLDLTKQYDECLDFVTNIFDEYLLGDDPVFSGDVVHIGADEYTANPNALRQFTNDMIDYVQEQGRTPRVWGAISKLKGDGTVEVDGHGAQINLWDEGWSDMMEMYELGFDLISCDDNDYYIVPNAGYYRDYLNTSTVYNLPVNQIGANYVPAGDKQMIGGMFAVWNDMTDVRLNGISEYDIYVRINKALPLFAAKLWGKQDNTLAQAQSAADTLGDAPNTNFGYEVEDVNEEDYAVKSVENADFTTAEDEAVLELKGGSSYATTGLTTAGLNNTLKVKVMRTSNSSEEQILLESDYGSIKAVQKGTGKVGISRELFDYSFNYTLPVGEWVELEFRNTFEQISLYVNGTKVDTLGDGDKAGNNRPMKATCMFPLAKIGSETKAFVGSVASVQLNGNEVLKMVEEAADYSAVEAAIAAANALDASLYTNFDVVTAAMDAVVYDLTVSHQAEVDAMAQTINDAISALEFKLADYSAVNEAIAVANALDPDAYTNFDAVTAAINAVVEGKNITEQAEVDAMAQAILDAISALEENASTKVENLVANVVDYKTISLSWDAFVGATSYTVERLSAEGDWIEVATTTDPTYIAAGVKTGKEYTYRVKADNAEYSEVVSVTPMLSGEVELSISMNGTNKFDLSWTGVEGATRYIIYRKASNGEWKKVLTLGKDARTYTSKEMLPDTYTYQVKAARYDSTERVMTSGSNLVEATASVEAEAFTLQVSKESDTTVALTWDKVAGMKYYEVYRSDASGTYRLLKRTTATSATNTVKVGKTYTYKLRAYNLVGDTKVYSAYSNEVSYTAQ